MQLIFIIFMMRNKKIIFLSGGLKEEQFHFTRRFIMDHFSSMKYLVGALALGVSSSATAGVFSWSDAVDAIGFKSI